MADSTKKNAVPFGPVWGAKDSLELRVKSHENPGLKGSLKGARLQIVGELIGMLGQEKPEAVKKEEEKAKETIHLEKEKEKLEAAAKEKEKAESGKKEKEKAESAKHEKAA